MHGNKCFKQLNFQKYTIGCLHTYNTGGNKHCKASTVASSTSYRMVIRMWCQLI